MTSQASVAVVVEDDPDIARLLVATLEPLGYEVVTERTVARAIDAVARCSPTLVTVDLGLPDADGLDVVRAVRDRCDAWVVVVSAQPDVVARAHEAGVALDGVVAKPFRPRDVRAQLSSLGATT